MMEVHVSDHDLERYYLGLVTDEEELANLEEHLLGCPECVERAEEAQDYVDAMRVALINVNDSSEEQEWCSRSLRSRDKR